MSCVYLSYPEIGLILPTVILCKVIKTLDKNFAIMIKNIYVLIGLFTIVLGMVLKI